MNPLIFITKHGSNYTNTRDNNLLQQQPQNMKATNKTILYSSTAHHLGQIGGLADTIHTAEGHGVGAASLLGLHHVTQNVEAPLWGQQLHQGLCQGIPHSSGDALKCSQHLQNDWLKVSLLCGFIANALLVSLYF